MLKTTGLLEKLTSKEIEVSDGNIIRFNVNYDNDSLNQKIVLIQETSDARACFNFLWLAFIDIRIKTKANNFQGK